MQDTLGKRKPGEHWQPEGGTVCHHQEDTSEVASKRSRASGSTAAQELALQLAEAAQQDAQLQEKAGANSTSSVSTSSQQPKADPTEPGQQLG